MIKKLFADGSAAKDTDQTRPMVERVAKQISMRIGNTIGPGGRNYMTPEGITNDGVSILQHIRFEDEREDGIADAFEEIARRQDRDAGDGTTTATLLGCTLTPLVLKDVINIETPLPGSKTVMDIKHELETECEAAVALLQKRAELVESLEDLEKVAKTAMEGHESYKVVAEAIWEVGKDSNTSIAEGYNGKVEKDVVPGIEMPLKIETPSMYTNVTRRESVLENPLIIVANHIFEAYSDLARFMTTMMEEKKKKNEGSQPIVIIAKKYSAQFVAQIVGLTRQTGIPILLLSGEGLKDQEFIDIAEFVDGQYVDTHPKEGRTMADFEYVDSGYAKKLIAGPEQTSFLGGRGLEAVVPNDDKLISRVEARVNDLKALAEKEQNPNEREEIERRAAGLKGGVATIYVDAKTAVDRFYLKKKIEDALNSCKAALDGGTVKGGGIALKEVAEEMDGAYLPKALEEVNKRVVQNAGGELKVPDDVRDAFYTNKSAIENAAAVVKILVTMEGVIVDKERTLVDDLEKTLHGGY